MSTYPYGTANPTGVFDIFQTNFSPDDVIRGIRDNYSPVNRTTLLNSVGYQIGLVQNFVNSSYLGRPNIPVQSGYIDTLNGNIVTLSGNINISGWKYSYFDSITYQSCCMTKSGIYSWYYDELGYVYDSYLQPNGYYTYIYLNPDKASTLNYARITPTAIKIYSSGSTVDALTLTSTSLTSEDDQHLDIEAGRNLYLKGDSVYLSGTYIWSQTGGVLPVYGTNQYLGQAGYRWRWIYSTSINSTNIIANPTTTTTIAAGASNPYSLSVSNSCYRITNENSADYVVDLSILSMSDGQIVMFLNNTSSASGLLLSGDIAGNQVVTLEVGDACSFVQYGYALYPLVPSGVRNG
jgi:hypothetical protein